MADEKKSSVETEYQLNDLESAPDYLANEGADHSSQAEGEGQMPPSAAKFNLRTINWRRLIVPVAIFIAIVAVYKGINYYEAKKNKGAEQLSLGLQEKGAKVQQAVVAPAPDASATNYQPLPTPTVSNDQLNNLQTALQQKFDDLNQQVNSSREQINSLNDAITKSAQQISVMSQNINQLAQVMQQSLDEIQKLTKPKIKPKKKEARPPVAYHVRAIVPGRVWLEAANGESVTLRVGDKLEGYGTVEVISPRQGMVIMSNGAIIQYGPNDI